MTIVDTPVIPSEAIILATLADCACDEVTHSGGGPLCWCGLWPGAIVSWEYCGECSGDRCGMGWVRLVSVFPYQVFPNPIVDERCYNPLAMAVEVGVLRCLPTPGDGEILGPEAMTDVAMTQAADVFALYRAIQCCDLAGAVGSPLSINFGIQTYVPVGPEGGCVGGAWTGFLAID